MLIINVRRSEEMPTRRSGFNTPLRPWFSRPGVVVNVRIAVKDTNSPMRKAAISPLLTPPLYNVQDPMRQSAAPDSTVKH
ncbi:hypothetical protein D3C81_1807760 [compost metagenome]